MHTPAHITCTLTNTLQDSVDKILTVLSTLEMLGRDHFEKSALELESFYSRTAYSSDAMVQRAKALEALETFKIDVQGEFPIIGERVAKGNFNFDPLFLRMQPTYPPAIKRLTDLKKHVPEHANIHLSEIERKYKEMEDETKKRVRTVHVSHYVLHYIFLAILLDCYSAVYNHI
jgi:hypothetical protein